MSRPSIAPLPPDSTGRPDGGARFVGILPAAGSASRLQPLRSPKELLPIVYVETEDGTGVRPVAAVEFALASLYLAGVRRCFVIVSDTKPEIARYLGDGTDRDMALGYLVQATPRGLADAVDVAYPWIGESYCCLALPDTVFSPADALDRVCRDLLDSAADLVLGVFPVANPGQLGPVRIDGDGAVLEVLEKPGRTDLANSWGVAAWSPAFTRYLHQRLAADGPVRHPSIGSVFDAARGDGLRVRAVAFPGGDFLDAGTPEGLKRLVGPWSKVNGGLRPDSTPPAQLVDATASAEDVPSKRARQQDDGRDVALAHAWHHVERAPGDAGALSQLGEALAACGHREEARQALEQALRLDPDNVAAHRGLGSLFAAENNVAGADLHLQRAIMLDAGDLDSLRRFGWFLYDTERLERAEAIARLAVATAPADGLAHHLLGWILKRRGRHQEARAALERAVACAPDLLIATRLLAELELAAGDAAAAEARLRAALERAPDDAELQRTLAWVLHDRRDLDGAEAAARRAVALAPESAEANVQLAWILIAGHRLGAAMGVCIDLLARQPRRAEAHWMMAELRQRQGQLEAAEDWLERALACDPGCAQALERLGALQLRLHRVAEAERSLRAAIAADADLVAGYLELARLLERQGRFAEAEPLLRTLISRKPGEPGAWLALGRLLESDQRDEAAAAALCRAVELDDEPREGWWQLGRLAARGVPAAQRMLAALDPKLLRTRLADLIDAAIGSLSFDEYRAIVDYALARFPGDDLLEAARQFGLVYDAGQTAESLRAAADDFGRRVRPRTLPARRPRARPRVGYVGNHLHRELMNGYIGFHDHDRFDISLFTTADLGLVSRRDPRLAIYRLDEVDLERACAAAELDLIIDIVGPYPRASLFKPYLALRRRLAPVQCLWLNTFATTGSPAYDYVILDPTLVRPGEEHGFSERVLRLPHSMWFWTKPEHAPAPGPLPALANGHVTFGSGNRGLKLNDAVLSLWAEVMAQLPNARLRLAGWYTDGWRLRRHILALFAAHGVAAERIDFMSSFDPERQADFYRGVDLTLDTFPFNGGLTTFEALWMGVPVVALAGERLTARQSEMILGLLGLDDWIARDRADFVARAVRLAGDLDQLTALRAGLRDRLRASPLCDGPRFARDLETLFLEMLGRS